MEGEENEQDSQDATALHTLSTVAVEHGAAVSSDGSPPIAGISGIQNSSSVPLIRLQPAQKRVRTEAEGNGQGANRLHKPQKVREKECDLKNAQSGEIPPTVTRREADLRERRSAPQVVPNLEKALRESRSAPDLSSHALATIRGLQGAIPLDRRLRSKIAIAAKRVLEARELKRRQSQEGGQPAILNKGTLTALTDFPSPKIRRTGSTNTSEGVQQSRPQVMSGGLPQIPALSSAASVPRSLATAAAIARGKSSPIPIPTQQTSPNNQATGDAVVPSSQANTTRFHRPSLSPTLQGGALSSGTYRPFTITTGVPRFAQGRAGAVAAAGGRVHPSPLAPLTPQGSALEQPPSPSSPPQAATGTMSTASITLSPGDLQLPPCRQNAD